MRRFKKDVATELETIKAPLMRIEVQFMEGDVTHITRAAMFLEGEPGIGNLGATLDEYMSRESAHAGINWGNVNYYKLEKTGQSNVRVYKRTITTWQRRRWFSPWAVRTKVSYGKWEVDKEYSEKDEDKESSK